MRLAGICLARVQMSEQQPPKGAEQAVALAAIQDAQSRADAELARKLLDIGVSADRVMELLLELDIEQKRLLISE